MHPSAINGKDSNGAKKKRRGGTIVEICQAKSCQDQSPTDNFLADIRRILISLEDEPRSTDEQASTSFFFLHSSKLIEYSYCSLSARTRRPRFRTVENFEREGSLETRRRIFPIDSIRATLNRTCDRNITSSFHYVRPVENDQEWGVISCFEGSFNSPIFFKKFRDIRKLNRKRILF